MIDIDLNTVAKAVHGKLCNALFADNLLINGVCIDTRDNLKDKLFIPLAGKNVDGHSFINTAYENGATCILTEVEINTNKPYILVKSTFQALKDFAKYYRTLFNIPVIAITGSVGKTTTKDLTHSILSKKYRTLKTEGNFNNEIGLPLTIFRLDHSIEVLVLEMGMNNFGEINNLSEIAKPSICLITNIGEAHIENLGSREGILKAKSEIFNYMDKNGCVILNGDDNMLIKLKDKLDKPYFYYLNKKSDKFFTAYDIKYNGIKGTSCIIKILDDEFIVNIPISGEYMVYNSLAASVVGKVLGLTNKQIQKGIESFKPSKNRMDIININGYTLINDVYNSSPTSVKSAINALYNHNGRKVCILGDMLELGKYANTMHYEVGIYAIEKGIDLLICIGNLSYKTYEGANEQLKKLGINNQDIMYFKTKEDFLMEGTALLNKDDTILIKASRGMQFEDIIEKLKED